jgi:hypothetical protein
MNDQPNYNDNESGGQFDFGDLLPDREIRSLIDRNFEQINFIQEWFESTQPGKLPLELIERQLVAGKMNKSDLNNLNHSLIFGKLDQLKKLEANLCGAFIYNFIASNLAKEDRLIQAWKAISQACSHLGHCNEIHADLTAPVTVRSKSGGEAKARKANELIKLIIITLIEDRPEKGWRKLITASDRVMTRYDRSSKDLFPAGTREDIHERIITLLHENKLIKVFYADD